MANFKNHFIYRAGQELRQQECRHIPTNPRRPGTMQLQKSKKRKKAAANSTLSSPNSCTSSANSPLWAAKTNSKSNEFCSPFMHCCTRNRPSSHSRISRERGNMRTKPGGHGYRHDRGPRTTPHSGTYGSFNSSTSNPCTFSQSIARARSSTAFKSISCSVTISVFVMFATTWHSASRYTSPMQVHHIIKLFTCGAHNYAPTRSNAQQKQISPSDSMASLLSNSTVGSPRTAPHGRPLRAWATSRTMATSGWAAILLPLAKSEILLDNVSNPCARKRPRKRLTPTCFPAMAATSCINS
mmetsp:Transcript_67810/g.220768  ORF Transcript_67810/g.220768 Transcript_67810/m.220768 type:complete len:298 (-) Transcript_67810:235-1128(-)